jgi:choline transporter-like protein 2/4/5
MSQLYNLFALLWGLFFLSAFEEMVMAGAFASWYWTFDKKNIPSAPLSASVYRVFRYHLGTLAFGSLIIAIIRFIRIMIEVIEERLKAYSQDNPLVKCVLCCCRCCFWCLESFMRFLNRNAYIMTAVYGKNFCWSAKEAFFLLLRNAARYV